MHCEGRNETARAYPDPHDDQSGKALDRIHDFVEGTGLDVNREKVTRIGQRSDCDILRSDDFASGQWQHYSKRYAATVQKSCTDCDQASAGSRRLEHRVSRVHADNVLPVLLDVLQATSDLTLTDNHVAVFAGSHETIEEQSTRLNSDSRPPLGQPI